MRLVVAPEAAAARSWRQEGAVAHRLRREEAASPPEELAPLRFWEVAVPVHRPPVGSEEAEASRRVAVTPLPVERGALVAAGVRVPAARPENRCRSSASS